MMNAILITLAIVQLIALVGLVACLPHLYRKEEAKGRSA